MEKIVKVIYNTYFKTNTNAHFMDGAIPIETIPNSGIYGKSSNDCFWISVADGLAGHGINVTPTILKKTVNFHYQHTMIDTNKTDHRDAILSLVNIYDLELHIHQGVYDKGKWYVQPVPVTSFVSPSKEYTIRIIQKPNHFEFISTDEGFFDLDRVEEDEADVIEEQRKIEARNLQHQKDLEMAIRLQLEENPNAVIKINYN